MAELSILCVILLMLVFILLAIIVAFLYDKYLKNRISVDRIYGAFRRNNNRHNTNDDVIEEDIESRMDANEWSRRQTIAKSDTFVKQELQLRTRVDDCAKTSVNEHEIEAIISPPMIDKCLSTVISKSGESSAENETISANSERSVSYKCSTPKAVSPSKNSMSSGGHKSVYSASKRANNTLPKRALFLRSPNNYSRSDDIITEMDAIIDESFEALKSTIDCMNYETLRYSCEDLSRD